MSKRWCAEDLLTPTPDPADVQLFSTSDALAAGAAECVVLAAAAAVRARGRFVLALSGGETPRSLYATLATSEFASRVDWARAEVFWGDERCVPPDNAASNARMARESLLDRVPVPAANVHRIHGEDDPAAAAAAYEHQLRAMFHTPVGAPEAVPGARFDLVLLGVGVNGHTASLFPGTAVLRETERWVSAVFVPDASTWRITLTAAIINAASEILFLVSGREKAAILQRVLEGPREPDVLPAQLIGPTAGRLRWLVDAEAATMLRRQ